MKISAIVSTMTTVLLLTGGIARCDSGLSYDDTVSLIKDTMANSPSSYREESYRSITFDKCNLDFNVLGKYPAGPRYDVTFSHIDFSSLNYQESRLRHDYVAFMELNFGNYLLYKSEDYTSKTRDVIINVSDDQHARILFDAFLRLGELCGAGKRPL